MADEFDIMDGRMKQKNADLETSYMRQKQIVYLPNGQPRIVSTLRF